MSYYNDLTAYYVDNDNEILRIMDSNYLQASPLMQTFWTEADIDVRFKTGDQQLWNALYYSLPTLNRRQFQFNRIRRVINMPCGYQRRNRKASIVVPREYSCQQTADDLSEVLQWANHTGNFYHMFSDAFEGALTSGFNLFSIWLDYRDDPDSGDIRFTNYYHNGVMLDPTFKRQDLSDCNWIWTRKWLSKKQVASLLPGREKEIMQIVTDGYRDNKFMYLPENYQYSIKDLLAYDEYWYLAERKAKVLYDTDTAESIEWQGDDETLVQYLHYNPSLTFIEVTKPTVHLAIVVNNRCFYRGPNLYKIDRYPFVGTFGYFEPECPYFSLKMQGMVRSLRDVQYLYNRRKVIELDILESQINSGIKFKEDALLDPDDAFLQGQGRRLAIRKSASMDDVQQLPTPDIPQTVVELSKILGNEITEISGISEELLGMADDNAPGILSMLRQGAGLTTLQTLFDQLDLSQKLAGQICLDLITQNFSQAKIRRILGREPSEQFRDKTFQKYDCDVAEGYFTTTQKAMQFKQLFEMKQAGINIPDSVLIDAAELQNKKELIDVMQQQAEQQQQQEQAQFQAQMQQQQVVTHSLESKAESDRALAQERLAKISTDIAVNEERISRSQHEQDAATLDRIRAVKELSTIDLQQLESLINIVKSLQQDEKQEVDKNIARR